MFSWKTKPEQVAALVARLERERDEALAEADAARAEIVEASLAIEDKEPEAESKLAKARKALEKALTRAEEKALVLKGAEARYSAALGAQREAEIAERWVKAEKLVEEREKLAEEVEQEAKVLVEKFTVLLKLGVEAHKAAPFVEGALNMSPLTPDEVTRDFRGMLQQFGLSWALTWPLPEGFSFTDRIRKSNSWVLLKRNSKRKQAV